MSDHTILLWHGFQQTLLFHGRHSTLERYLCGGGRKLKLFAWHVVQEGILKLKKCMTVGTDQPSVRYGQKKILKTENHYGLK